MPDWIPNDEPGRDRLFQQYLTYLNANPGPLGVPPAKATALNARFDALNQAREARDEFDRQAGAVHQRHTDALEAFVAELRTLDGEIMARRETTAEQRRALGRAVADTVRSAAGRPASRPVIVRVNASQRLTHILHWVDENSPGSKAKPPGVVRAILFRKVGGPPPADAKEMLETAGDTASPYLYEFDAADAGKPCHWAVCWENSAAERGPLSAVSTWTVPG